MDASGDKLATNSKVEDSWQRPTSRLEVLCQLTVSTSDSQQMQDSKQSVN